MNDQAWESRVEEPLAFYYHADSYVQHNLDEIVAGWQKALVEVSSFLGQSESGLPRIHVYLSSFQSEPPSSRPDSNGHEPGTNGLEAHSSGSGDVERVEIWTTVNSESPGANPVQELARVLLARIYGHPEPEARFWHDGLAGYLAGKSGSSDYHAEAPERIRKLFDAGQLPPLIDLLQLYSVRQSNTSISVSTAFVWHLIDSLGADRYKRFLGTLKEGRNQAFRRIYGTPVQSLEQAWYRTLEKSSSAGSASMADALKQLLPYMKMYRWHLLGILGCILVTIIFAIFMPLSIRFLVNNILARRPLPFSVPGIADAGDHLEVGTEQQHALLELLASMIFMFVLSAFSNTRRSFLAASMGEGVNYDLRMRFFNQLQQLPVAFHRRTPNQDISQRFMLDVATISQALTFGVVPMIQSGLALLIFGLVLISLNWKLSLIALAGLPVFAISFQRMRARMRDNTRERARRTTDVSQSLVETLNAQEKVKLYGLRGYLTERFIARLQLLRELVVKITLMSSTSASTSALITNGAQVAVLVIGGILVIESQAKALAIGPSYVPELTSGDLMAFYVLLLQFYAPAGLFTSSMQYVNQATTSLDRVNGILKQEADQDRPDAVEIGPLQEAIRFESVGYGRGKGKDLLKDLSLEIPVGSKVAFVGPPGAGKASLMELLPRLFEVADGAITWDGTDIRQATAASLRSQLAVISQETFVFNATVYDNIRYGRVEATDDEVIEASRQAGLHEFILGLPGGYDTQVNDRDSSFGLVQRQRLAVARALLQNASVILMDDALSALDAQGQRGLEEVLRGPNGDRTLIRVAQRLGATLDARRIFVLDGGELVEQGRHEELTDAGGLYTQLLKDELGAGAVSGAFQAVRRLSKQAPFSSLAPEVLEEVARLMLYAERSPGDDICRQGSVGDELFVLGRGEVQIVFEDEDGDEHILATLQEGEYFGEISFLRRVPRVATVRARTNVELHILRRQDFDQLLERLGADLTAELDRTAQERIEENRASIAAAEATPA